MSAEGAGVARRLDKWLWCARRFRTRSLAARFIAENSVRLTRGKATQRVDQPGFQLREGDEISFVIGERLAILAVAGFAERRGPAEASKRLYEDRSSGITRSGGSSASACKA